MGELRTLINNFLAKNVDKGEKVALLYSGGYESFACLCSLLEIGALPVLYTFVLNGTKSKDLTKAKHDAEVYGLELNICVIPNDYETLKKDTHKIIGEWNTSRKTVVQCLHPLYYTIPLVKEKKIVSGLEKGNLWGDTKNGAIAGHKGKAIFDEYRRYEAKKDEFGSTSFFDKYLLREGHESIRPFGSDEIFEWFMCKDFFELNKPHLKNPIWEEYQEEIRFSSMRPKTANYQIESGIKLFHEELLKDESLNEAGKYKSVVGIYNQILKEIQNAQI
jgi:hypothetical protein